MNYTLLNKLVNESKLGKAQIAKMAKISRTTLDNALNGADIKVSTVENIAEVLGVNTNVFWNDDAVIDQQDLNMYEREIKRLQTLLDKKSKSTKVVVELDVTEDEFVRLGLKDKVIQILN